MFNKIKAKLSLFRAKKSKVEKLFLSKYNKKLLLIASLVVAFLGLLYTKRIAERNLKSTDTPTIIHNEAKEELGDRKKTKRNLPKPSYRTPAATLYGGPNGELRNWENNQSRKHYD